MSDYLVIKNTALNQREYDEAIKNGIKVNWTVGTKPSLPSAFMDLEELDQHLLTNLYGRCHSIKAVANETSLSPKEIYQHIDNAWSSFDMRERQQFLYYWGTTDNV